MFKKYLQFKKATHNICTALYSALPYQLACTNKADPIAIYHLGGELHSTLFIYFLKRGRAIQIDNSVVAFNYISKFKSHYRIAIEIIFVFSAGTQTARHYSENARISWQRYPANIMIALWMLAAFASLDCHFSISR